MKKKFPMVVTFTIKDEHMDYVKQQLLNILEPTRKEDGCLLYELHQDLECKNTLIFYEVWASKEDWMAHDQSPHIKTFISKTKGLIEKTIVHKLEII